MKNKIILITGAPGVGQTDTAKALISKCPKKSVYIDTNTIAAIRPNTLDINYYNLLCSNLEACIANYQIWGAELIVISGVVLPSNILDRLLKSTHHYSWSIYGLYKSEDSRKQIIYDGSKEQYETKKLAWEQLNEETKKLKNATPIDNTRLNIEETANLISVKEGIVLPAKVQDKKLEFVEVEYESAFSMVNDIFHKLNVKPEVSEKVIDDLIFSDIEGHHSHGLLRLHDYLREIKKGTILPDAEPSVNKISNISRLIDGKRSFGAISREVLATCIQEILLTQKVAIVGLKNSNHIGRLHHLADSVCQDKYIILGFVNYLGAGQKVPIWNGTEGRFCTNPILIGIPRKNKPNLILDMSTSAVSEGKVREYQINQQQVPEGWLIDKNWKSVNDPDKLYSQPKDIFIAPLGGEIGYKGAALALIVDILAGIITDAGYSKAALSLGGNGGLFIAFPIDILGTKLSQIDEHINELVTYCKSSEKLNKSQEIRIPGENSYLKRERFKKTNKITYSKQVWNKITQIQSII